MTKSQSRIKYPERMEASFPKGTFRRLAKVLRQFEDRTAFVRDAVEKAIAERLTESPRDK